MRRVWIAIGILLLTLSVCIYAYADVTKKCTQLEETALSLARCLDSGEQESADKEKTKLKQQWESSLTLFSAVLTHSHFDDISESVNDIVDDKKASDDEIIERCYEAVYYLNHLKESQKLDFKNIF